MPPHQPFSTSGHRPTQTIRAHACVPQRRHRAYERTRDLPALLPVWPDEIANMTPEKHHRLIQRIRRALREERRRGLAGAWSYDLARHAGLYRALQEEIAATPPPLSSWAAAIFRNEHSDPVRPAKAARRTQDAPMPPADSVSRDGFRAPSSSRVATGPQHSSVQPSDSHAEAATSRDTLPATSCSASANAA